MQDVPQNALPEQHHTFKYTTTITLKEIGNFFYVSHHISKMKNQFVKEFLQQQFIVRKFWCGIYFWRILKHY